MAEEPNSQSTREPSVKPKVSITVSGSPLTLQRAVGNQAGSFGTAAALSKQIEALNKPFVPVAALSKQIEALNKPFVPVAALSKQMEGLNKSLKTPPFVSGAWNGQMLDAFAKHLDQVGRKYKARTFDFDFSKTPEGRQLALLGDQVGEMRMLREEARRDREAAKRDRQEAHRDRLWGRVISAAGVLVGVAGFLVALVR